MRQLKFSCNKEDRGVTTNEKQSRESVVMEVKGKLSGRERDVLGQFDGDMGCFPRSATVARLHHDSTPQPNVSSWRFCPFFVRMIVRQTDGEEGDTRHPLNVLNAKRWQVV